RRFPLILLAMSCALGADFVGNRVCASCHAAIYRTYMRTPMAQSSGTVGTGDLKETFDRAEFRDDRNAFSYTVSPDYRLEFNQRSASQPITGRRNLPWFIGSGAAARTFLIEDGGFLY